MSTSFLIHPLIQKTQPPELNHKPRLNYKSRLANPFCSIGVSSFRFAYFWETVPVLQKRRNCSYYNIGERDCNYYDPSGIAENTILPVLQRD